MSDYTGPERRQAALTEDKVALMIQTAVSDALKAHEQHLTLHMDKQFGLLRQAFNDAFPGGDPHGHRLAHERQIANASWWEKTKSDAFSKVTAAGLWAVVVFMAVAAWEHIKQEARR
jgi:hypothetical protein